MPYEQAVSWIVSSPPGLSLQTMLIPPCLDSDPIYDHSSDDGVAEAKFDLLYKLCNFLVFRLEIYQDNLKRIKQGLSSAGFRTGALVTEQGFFALFNTNPLETDYIPRKLCASLEIVEGSFRNFWTGFYGAYFRLLWVTSPLPNQPKHLREKHYLVIRYLFGYLRYVNDSISTKFGEFREFIEIHHFLKLLVHTQYLLSDLMDFSVTPNHLHRGAFREHDTKLRHLCDQISSLRGLWSDQLMDTRGVCNDEILKPDPDCEAGQYVHLNFIDNISVLDGRMELT